MSQVCVCGCLKSAFVSLVSLKACQSNKNPKPGLCPKTANTSRPDHRQPSPVLRLFWLLLALPSNTKCALTHARPLSLFSTGIVFQWYHPCQLRLATQYAKASHRVSTSTAPQSKRSFTNHAPRHVRTFRTSFVHFSFGKTGVLLIHSDLLLLLFPLFLLFFNPCLHEKDEHLGNESIHKRRNKQHARRLVNKAFHQLYIMHFCPYMKVVDHCPTETPDIPCCVCCQWTHRRHEKQKHQKDYKAMSLETMLLK